MKWLFILLFIPVITSAQDCNLKNERDRFNQDPRLTTGFKALGAGSNKFLLSISAGKKEIDFFFALDKSATCFNDLSRAMITFDNRQRTSYRNGGTTNCKGYFHFIFPNQEKLNANLTVISIKRINTIQFTDISNKKEILTLRPEDQEEIIKLTACVLAELEKLRVDTWKPKQ
jgi:hypothetical protein